MTKEKQYEQKFSRKLGFHSFPELMTNLSSGSLFSSFFLGDLPLPWQINTCRSYFRLGIPQSPPHSPGPLWLEVSVSLLAGNQGWWPLSTKSFFWLKCSWISLGLEPLPSSGFELCHIACQGQLKDRSATPPSHQVEGDSPQGPVSCKNHTMLISWKCPTNLKGSLSRRAKQCRTAQVYRNQRNGDLIFRNKIVSNLSYQAKEN